MSFLPSDGEEGEGALEVRLEVGPLPEVVRIKVWKQNEGQKQEVTACGRKTWNFLTSQIRALITWPSLFSSTFSTDVSYGSKCVSNLAVMVF